MVRAVLPKKTRTISRLGLGTTAKLTVSKTLAGYCPLWTTVQKQSPF